jgi:hypothetical protein
MGSLFFKAYRQALELKKKKPSIKRVRRILFWGDGG